MAAAVARQPSQKAHSPPFTWNNIHDISNSNRWRYQDHNLIFRSTKHLSARDPGVVALEQLVHGELDGGVGDQHQRGLRPVPEAAQPLLQRAQLSITSCRFEALS